MRQRWVWSWFKGILTLLALLAIQPTVAAPPLVLGQDIVSLDGGELSLLEDSSHQLGWKGALAAQRAGAFQDIPYGVGEGFSRSVYWAHATLERGAQIPDEWAFMITPAYLDRVDFYLLQDGKLLDHLMAGDLVEDPEHDLHQRLHFVGSRIPEGRSELLMRLETSSTSVLLVQAAPRAKVAAAIDGRLLSEGIMIGILLMVLVINLLNGVWLRRSLFIYFVAYEACLLLTLLLINGFMRDLVPSMSAEQQNLLMQLGVLSSGFLAFVFFKRMLSFPFRGACGVHLLFWGGMILALVGMVFAAQGEYVRIMYYVNRYVSLFPVFVSIPLIQGWRHMDAEQKFRAGGCFVFGVFVSINGMYTLGYIPVTLATTYIAPMMILSFQLSLHFIIMFSVRKSERTLLDAQRKVELSERETGMERSQRMSHETFLAMFAHEVRTPLAVIDTSAQSLDVLERKDNSREQRQQRYQRIREAVKRINQLLHLSLLRGRQDVDRLNGSGAAYDVPGLVLKVAGEFEPADRDRIRFETPAPELMFRSSLSEPLLGVVLRNLIDNGLKYSPAEAPVEVRVMPNECGMVLSVRDYGSGMTDYVKRRMFERHFRDSERESIPGLGLGLFVVKEVMDRYNGRIEVETGQGGTCVLCVFKEE